MTSSSDAGAIDTGGAADGDGGSAQLTCPPTTRPVLPSGRRDAQTVVRQPGAMLLRAPRTRCRRWSRLAVPRPSARRRRSRRPSWGPERAPGRGPKPDCAVPILGTWSVGTPPTGRAFASTGARDEWLCFSTRVSRLTLESLRGRTFALTSGFVGALAQVHPHKCLPRTVARWARRGRPRSTRKTTHSGGSASRLRPAKPLSKVSPRRVTHRGRQIQ